MTYEKYKFIYYTKSDVLPKTKNKYQTLTQKPQIPNPNPNPKTLKNQIPNPNPKTQRNSNDPILIFKQLIIFKNAF